MKYKFILWGVGATYNRLFYSIKYHELMGRIEIVAIVDKFLKNDSSIIDGYCLITCDDIKHIEYDYIVVLSNIYFKNIYNELIICGIDSEKILSYKFLEIPNINIDDFIKLKESNISIVSNNCWGGIVYNTLGIECLSPFKNLFIDDMDYIHMLKNFQKYLLCEPVLFEYVFDKTRNIKYPVLLLNDILLHCNHDTDAEEAISKWKHRCKKFNISNIFVEMYTCSKEIGSEFSKLVQYSKKICFVPFETDLPCLMKLELYNGQCEFWQTVNSNAGVGKDSFKYNLIDLLCMKKCLRMDNKREC